MLPGRLSAAGKKGEPFLKPTPGSKLPGRRLKRAKFTDSQIKFDLGNEKPGRETGPPFNGRPNINSAIYIFILQISSVIDSKIVPKESERYSPKLKPQDP